MRIAGSILAALLIGACGRQASQTDNLTSDANPRVVQADAATAEALRNEPQAAPAASQPQGDACRTQGQERVEHKLKAIGTEPFWAAEVDGRCVTYKTPEDQNGTRVWTKVSATAPSIIWSGALHGKPFELTVTPKADCSDGMSDKSYPMEVVLLVDGETRHGCSEPL